MRPRGQDYFSKSRFSINEIRLFLARRLGYRVPDSTLKRWKRHLGITAENWRYTEHDRDLLLTLGRWLQSGGTVNGFHDWQAQLRQAGESNAE